MADQKNMAPRIAVARQLAAGGGAAFPSRYNNPAAMVKHARHRERGQVSTA
jgi:hypothetical protein